MRVKFQQITLNFCVKQHRPMGAVLLQMLLPRSSGTRLSSDPSPGPAAALPSGSPLQGLCFLNFLIS